MSKQKAHTTKKPVKSAFEESLTGASEPETFPLDSPPVPAPSVASTSSPAAEKPNKTEAIRRALAAGKIKPQEAVEWIKQQFDLDVSTQTFSTTKVQLQKKTGTQVGAGSRRPVRSVFTRPAPGGGTQLDLVRSVKALISQHGPDAVREVIDILAD